MFWEKRFYGIDVKIENLIDGLSVVSRKLSSLEAEIAKMNKIIDPVIDSTDDLVNKIAELENKAVSMDKLIVAVRNSVNERVTKNFVEQNDTNKKQDTWNMGTVGILSDLSLKVDSIIESHPNQAMYYGIFNKK